MHSVPYAHIKSISVKFISGSLGLKLSQRPFELTKLSVLVATHSNILAWKKSHGQRKWQAWGSKELDTTECFFFFFQCLNWISSSLYTAQDSKSKYLGEFVQMYEKYFSLYGFLPLILLLPFESTLNKANTSLPVYFTKMLEDNYWALLLCNVTKILRFTGQESFPPVLFRYWISSYSRISQFLETNHDCSKLVLGCFTPLYHRLFVGSYLGLF